MTDAHSLKRLTWVAIPSAVLVVLVLLWNWDWFIPIVESEAAAALGRPVTIGHLHVRLYPQLRVVADDVEIADPPGWRDGDPPLASIGELTIEADARAYLAGRGLIMPLIAIDRPTLYVAETADGASNFKFPSSGGDSSALPKIGDLRISDGNAHVVLPNLKADFRAKIATRETSPNAPEIVATADGAYAAQPIVAHLVGGALLSLRDKQHPWPIDLTLANGPTHVTLKGTVDDPLALAGANLDLRFSGPDLGLLGPLVGFPIPKTPAYHLDGRLDFEGFNRIRFEIFRGSLGSSDVEGTVVEHVDGSQNGAKPKPDVTLDLRSNRVDLADLSGFIGGTPGRATTANATPQEREAAAKASASPKLLPDTPISIPRLNWADIHLNYQGAHILGRDMPLDDLVVALDIVDGRVAIHPLSFGVGKGQLLTNVDLTPTSEKMVHAKADLRMRNLDLSRLMAATHTFEGAGSISGVGTIDSTGNSLASLLANGNGAVKMAMAGGNLSAVLVDLTGLEFGKALLSALGVPERTEVQCFVGDLGLKRGDVSFNAMTLDTGEAIVNVGGDVNLASEAIDLHLKTDSKHFSVGSLPTRINISGTFKDPRIRPGAEVAARVGAAAGLAVLFAPLAILPTVQFGTSDAEDARCGELLRAARAQAGGKALPVRQQVPGKQAATIPRAEKTTR